MSPARTNCPAGNVLASLGTALTCAVAPSHRAACDHLAQAHQHPAELTRYCLSALGAERTLPSEAAVRRLVTVTLAGVRPSED